MSDSKEYQVVQKRAEKAGDEVFDDVMWRVENGEYDSYKEAVEEAIKSMEGYWIAKEGSNHNG